MDGSGGLLEGIAKKENVHFLGIDVNNKHLKTKDGVEKISNVITSGIRGVKELQKELD